MASDQVLINLEDVAAVPREYELPLGAEYSIQVATAVYDGTAAGADFLPALVITGPGGVPVGTFADQAVKVAAGGSAEVTFGTFLGSQTSAGCCDTSSSTYTNVITQTGPRAWWRFNETAGNTAADSTGNGWTLNVANVGALGPGKWAWNQPAGPPGDVTVTTNGGGPSATNATFPSFVNNFAFGAWVRVDNQFSNQPAIMNQGDPQAAAANGGWCLSMDSPTGKWYVLTSTGTAYNSVFSSAAGTIGTFALVGGQMNNGTLSLWVNGVQQPGSVAATIKPHTGVTFATDDAGGFYLRGGLSWSFVWDRPLTAAEWASLAVPGGNVPSGWVLTSTGGGSSTYAPLTSGSAPAGYRLTSDGAGGVYWAP